MAKTQCNYPTSLDVLNTDRVAGQDILSVTDDIIETAITQIEAELRRVTVKTGVATLTSSEGGFIKVSAAGAYALTLPTAVGNTGLTYIFVKTDDNANLITIDGNASETINGSLTYTGLNSQYAYVTIRSDNANWYILFRSGLANVIEDTTPELGGEMDCGAHSVGFTIQTVSYDVTTTTVDWKLGNKATMTFGAGNIGTFAFTNPTNPCNVVLKIIQDATGSRVVTAWDADIKWNSGTVPTLSTGANAVDIVSFYWDGSAYYGVANLNFS